MNYSFKLKGTAFGGASFESDLIKFEVCDPNAMRADETTTIERIFGLNS